MEFPMQARLIALSAAALFATINLVAEQPELGRFRFQATNHWISGTNNRTTINGFYGAGQQHSRAQDYTVDADHPAVLCGEDLAPTPAELLLAALAACLTSGLGKTLRGLRVPADELPDYIERVTRKFDEQRLDGELFAQWTQRADEEDLR
jgi:uncharacterized OsmC-like protein